jgi:hypothetical protein
MIRVAQNKRALVSHPQREAPGEENGNEEEAAKEIKDGGSCGKRIGGACSLVWRERRKLQGAGSSCGRHVLRAKMRGALEGVHRRRGAPGGWQWRGSGNSTVHARRWRGARARRKGANQVIRFDFYRARRGRGSDD